MDNGNQRIVLCATGHLTREVLDIEMSFPLCHLDCFVQQHTASQSPGWRRGSTIRDAIYCVALKSHDVVYLNFRTGESHQHRLSWFCPSHGYRIVVSVVYAAPQHIARAVQTALATRGLAAVCSRRDILTVVQHGGREQSRAKANPYSRGGACIDITSGQAFIL